MIRFFPTLAFAAFAFGVFNGHAHAGPVDAGEPLLLQLMSGNRVVVAPPPVRRAAFTPAIAAPRTAAPRTAAPAQPAASGRYGRPVDPAFLPAIVAYPTDLAKGTIVIDTEARYLYFVLGGGMAKRYGVGVGRPGFEWAGTRKITRKAEWPVWVPPEEMRQRVPNLPVRMEGGPANPLGARALYLGSTLYRIHGSNEPWTIGHAVSSGCIRMRNEDVIDLYEHVKVGTKVIVR